MDVELEMFGAVLRAEMERTIGVFVGKVAKTSEGLAKGMIGHYDNGADWPALDRNVTVKIHQAIMNKSADWPFATADTPLYRTGALLRSIESEAGDDYADVGTDDPVMALHELGIGVPARPIFQPVADKMGALVQGLLDEAVMEVIGTINNPREAVDPETY